MASHSRFRRLGRALLVVITCVSLAPAAALGAKKKIAVVPAEDAGPADAPIQAKITKVLKKQKIQIVGAAQVKKATKKDGLPSADEDWVKLAQKLKVDGFVEITLSQTGTKRRAEIRVRNGEDGAISVRENFAAKGPPKKLAGVVAGSFWKKLGPSIKATSAPKKGDAGGGLAARDLPPSEESGSASAKPEGSEEKPAAEPEREEKVAIGDEDKDKDKEKEKEKESKDNAESEEKPAAKEDGDDAENKDDEEEEKPVRRRAAKGDGDKDSDSGSPRALEIEIGTRLVRRVFQYVPSNAAKYYLLSFAPLLAVRVAYFPITYVGAFASIEYNGALKTGAYPTATREFIVGGAVRIPLGMAQIGASAGFFQHLFVILDTAATGDAPRSSILTPNTTYMGGRFAVNGRLRLGDMILLGAEGAYRLVTNPGSPAEGPDQVRSANFFPNGIATAAFDGSAFVGVGIMSWLEIRAGFDYRRYILGRFQGSPSVPLAQSAVDDYLGFTLGAVGVLGGK